MRFQVGDKAVVPALGVGVIKEIETLHIQGQDFTMYVIKILDNGLTYKVPVDRVESNGIREIMSTDKIDRVYVVLGDRDKPADKQTWNRRYRGFREKIDTGSIYDVAEVMRDLYRLKTDKQLSFGEKRMLDTARALIVREIAISRGQTEEQVKNEIEAIFTAS